MPPTASWPHTGEVISYNIFLDRQRLPSAADWSRVLTETGFGTQLAPDFDPRTHSGYLPCPDERTGFEYYFETFDTPAVEFGEGGAQAIGNRDAVVSLRLSGRPADRTAAIASAATLAAMADGVLFDSEPGHFIASADALAWARNDRYQPLAIQRRRSARRKARLTPPIILRLLIILLLVAAIYWLGK